MPVETRLFDLTGKVAIITGSSKGIGKSIATAMAQHGAKVAISSRKAEACEKVASEINASCANGGGEAQAIPANIGKKEDLQNLVDQTREKWGRIDIVVCNAAVNPYYGPSSDISDSAFDKILASNVKSNHWLCNMVLPEMVERKDGVILVVSSIGGLRASTVIGKLVTIKACKHRFHIGCGFRWWWRSATTTALRRRLHVWLQTLSPPNTVSLCTYMFHSSRTNTL